MKIKISVSASLLSADNYSITSIPDAKTPTFVVSCVDTKTPTIEVIRDLAFPYSSRDERMADTYSISGIPLTVGGKTAHPNTSMKFKSNKVRLVFKGSITPDAATAQVKKWIEVYVAKNNKYIKAAEKRKKDAPAREKANRALYAEERQQKRAALDAKYGKGTADRVKIRQIGGDDGYQYNVIVDGRSIMNGLTRMDAMYYQRVTIDNLAKKEKLGVYSKMSGVK